MKNIKLAALLSAFFLFSDTLLAEEIVIKDSSGAVRHIADVQASAEVKFSLIDQNGTPTADGTLVYITKETDNTKRESISVAGVVEFLDVAPGTWIISAQNNDKLILSQLEVSEFGQPMADFSLFNLQPVDVNPAPIIGGALVIGGVAGGIYAYRENDDSNEKPSKTFGVSNDPSPFS